MVCAALLWFIDIAMLFCGLQRWSSYRELTGAVSAYRFSNFHLTRDSRLLTCIMLQVHTHHRRPRYPPWTLGRTCKLAASGGGSPPPARHRLYHALYRTRWQLSVGCLPTLLPPCAPTPAVHQCTNHRPRRPRYPPWTLGRQRLWTEVMWSCVCCCCCCCCTYQPYRDIVMYVLQLWLWARLGSYFSR